MNRAEFASVVHTRVFAAHAGGGNPCPVVVHADALTDEQMQSLARRFGLDTAFVLEPRDPRADVRVRFFVPDHEMGVSGHATIAAITVALTRGSLGGNRLTIETLNGSFDVSVKTDDRRVSVTLEQLAPTFGPIADIETTAKVLGTSAKFISRESPVQSVSVSRAKLLVPLRDSNVLAQLVPDFPKMWELCDELNVSGIYAFTRETDKSWADAEARQFPLRAGFPEDAATGVAAGALGAYLTHYDRNNRSGEHTFRIAQGYAMGAASEIEVLVECQDMNITRTAVCGRAEIISEEEVQL